MGLFSFYCCCFLLRLSLFSSDSSSFIHSFIYSSYHLFHMMSVLCFVGGFSILFLFLFFFFFYFSFFLFFSFLFFSFSFLFFSFLFFSFLFFSFLFFFPLPFFSFLFPFLFFSFLSFISLFLSFPFVSSLSCPPHHILPNQLMNETRRISLCQHHRYLPNYRDHPKHHHP